jgi:hypothetical protein
VLLGLVRSGSVLHHVTGREHAGIRDGRLIMGWAAQVGAGWIWAQILRGYVCVVPIVQWLGHRPFTAVTRVRIPLGTPICRRAVPGTGDVCDGQG